MKFAVCTNKPAAKPQVAPITLQDITEAYEGMLAAYMELTDAQRNLNEVCQAMDNINLSMQMIQTGGMDAVNILNVDKSLEALCDVEAKLLTVNKAQEGLGEGARKLWNKFVAFIKGLIAKLIAFVDKFIPNKFTVVKQKLESLKQRNTSTESLAATEGIKLTAYCDKFIEVAKEMFTRLDTVKEGITHVYNSLSAVARQSADAESKEDVKKKLADIVYSNDSYFFKVKDAFTAINDLNHSGAGIDTTDLDETTLTNSHFHALEELVREATDRVKPFREMLMQYSRDSAAMESLCRNYESLGDTDQVGILHILVTGYNGCINDIKKALFIFNAIADRTGKIADKATRLVD